MPSNVDSVIANEALQQTSAPPCSPRLFTYFSAPLQLAAKRLVINIFMVNVSIALYFLLFVILAGKWRHRLKVKFQNIYC